MGILFFTVFASIARSLICIPLDSINKSNLQQGNYAYSRFRRSPCTCATALCNWQSCESFREGHCLSLCVRVNVQFQRVDPWINFLSWIKMQSNENLLLISGRGEFILLVLNRYLLLPLLALIGRSQICIPDDSTNKLTLQHRTISIHCSCGVRLRIFKVARWVCNCLSCETFRQKYCSCLCLRVSLEFEELDL